MPDLPLTPWLIEWAYSRGIFPMAMDDGSVAWFQPDPRCILPLDGFRATRSLRKSARRFEVTFDSAFESVMRACADRDETWISEEFIRVYTELFNSGKCRSSEAWLDGKLVGGVYGVVLGSAFMAESMFHTETDAGKVALWKLVEHLRGLGFGLMDLQFQTPHLKTLGAVEIPHHQYMELLSSALK